MSSITYPAIQLSGSKLSEKHANLDAIRGVESSVKLTLDPKVHVRFGGEEMQVEIEGDQACKLSGRIISDGRNLGPYIEELTYQMEPVSNVQFISADSPLVKEQLKSCFSDQEWKQYNSKDLSCLKKSYAHERMWGLYLSPLPDTIGDVTEKAKTAFSLVTKEMFKPLDPKESTVFKVTIQATLAFVSNENLPHPQNDEKTNSTSQYIHVVRAVHRVWKEVCVLPSKTSTQEDFHHSCELV